MRIGILAVQGAFIEHEQMLSQLGAECIEIRQASDISRLDSSCKTFTMILPFIWELCRLL